MIVTRVSLASGHHIATIEAGPHDAPAIVLIHGIAQSKQAFARLLAGPLATTVRLIALDLRGHGDSDDPAADASVTRADLAADVAAVVTGLGLVRPWLAGWSFGGVVIGEYLRRFGDDGLGGLLYLAGSVRTGREAASLFGPVMMNHARGLLSEDVAEYAAAARAFVAEGAAVPLAPAALDRMVADMLRVPARVRRPLLAGGEDYRATLAATRVPLATIHGALDPVVLPAMSDLVGACRPDVTAIRIPGAGHTPWLETPAQFDAAIAAVLAL